MPPDEPNDEERLEEEENDFQTPFSFPEEEEVSIADEDGETPRRPELDLTHPSTDTNIQIEEVYDEGPSGAAEASEPNAGDTVIGYHKPSDEGEESGESTG